MTNKNKRLIFSMKESDAIKLAAFISFHNEANEPRLLKIEKRIEKQIIKIKCNNTEAKEALANLQQDEGNGKEEE